MHSAGLRPPIKAVALPGNLHIRHPWAEHGVRGESGCSAQSGYLLLSLHLKKFVHDDAEYLYQTGCQRNLMILSFRYSAS